MLHALQASPRALAAWAGEKHSWQRGDARALKTTMPGGVGGLGGADGGGGAAEGPPAEDQPAQRV